MIGLKIYGFVDIDGRVHHKLSVRRVNHPSTIQTLGGLTI